MGSDHDHDDSLDGRLTYWFARVALAVGVIMNGAVYYDLSQRINDTESGKPCFSDHQQEMSAARPQAPKPAPTTLII